MTNAASNVTERHIPVSYDSKGNPVWRSIMSQPDDSMAICHMVPDRIIPIIFVPGVMGSNLKTKNGVKWLMDSPKTMLPWATRGAKMRKKNLTPTAMTLDRDGSIPGGTAQSEAELKSRGWGEVGNFSYGEFLVWLENTLNDFDSPHGGERDRLIGAVLGANKGEEALIKDEVALSYKYRFPVHACGYNWLDSNREAAKHLQHRINDVIKRYQSAKKKCDKVIIVTHSMGGLVARHCSEVLGMQDKIFGIVHGVMPAIGAAAVYRRMKAGTENAGEWVLGKIEGWLGSKALGEDAAEMTAVLSSAPGPLQLLPTPEYGNGWLRVRHGESEYSLPKNGDPYEEIYTVRGEWWSLCEDHLINPLNEERDRKKWQAQVDQDWKVYEKMIYRDVKQFHQDIASKYHPTTFAFYGNDAAYRAYGNVTWHGRSSAGEDLLRGSRPVYPMRGRALDPSEVNRSRTVAAPLGGAGWKTGIHQTYRISEPDEGGDGTVPRRSGIAPQTHAQSMLPVAVGHEPAFKESHQARLFTLRAIVKIAQAVQQTTLAY